MLWINAVMFVVIAVAALYSRSTALLSGSLDNLGDALTYALRETLIYSADPRTSA